MKENKFLIRFIIYFVEIILYLQSSDQINLLASYFFNTVLYHAVEIPNHRPHDYILFPQAVTIPSKYMCKINQS